MSDHLLSTQFGMERTYSCSKLPYHLEWRYLSRDSVDVAQKQSVCQAASKNVRFLEVELFYDKKTELATSEPDDGLCRAKESGAARL
jgi:hypothetical protein